MMEADKRKQKKYILFNPVSIVHYRNIKLFEERLKGWVVRCIAERRLPWASKFSEDKRVDTFYFDKDDIPAKVFDNIKCVVIFSSQIRPSSCNLLQEAVLRSIPVIAIEEGYQMMLEQGYVSSYVLPVDHLFVASKYERDKFLEMGMPPEVVEVTGYVFGRDGSGGIDPLQKEKAKEKLGLSKNKLIATLSLAYLTDDGETLEIRKQLLNLVHQGLSAGYELLVKPHPAETDKEINTFIKRYAPTARVANRYMPIDEVLDATDVLFNRGNSQVLVQSLSRGIPVIAVPMGRNTLFHGLLDDVIADNTDDIKKALAFIKEKGMDAYTPVFEKYLYIKSEDSLNMAISRITHIAENNELYNPNERLMELALFWAWMGYASRSISILGKLDNKLMEQLRRLVSYKEDEHDLRALRMWAGYGYKKWLTQSLCIKSLYSGVRKMGIEDRDWLADFPPRMNRVHFLSYAYLLCWCYLKSGMRPEAKAMIERLGEEFGPTKHIRNLLKAIDARSDLYTNLQYWNRRLRYPVINILKNR